MKASKSHVNPGIMSSEHMDWSTPTELFQQLGAVFHFDFDAAANSHNTKCERFLSAKDDSLERDEKGYATVWPLKITRKYDIPLSPDLLPKTAWLNSPYGLLVKPFMQMAYEQSVEYGLTVAVLCAHRTDAWFHKLVLNRATYLLAFEKRIRFTRTGISTEKSSPAFPSALAVFTPPNTEIPAIYTLHGKLGFVTDLRLQRRIAAEIKETQYARHPNDRNSPEAISQRETDSGNTDREQA